MLILKKPLKLKKKVEKFFNRNKRSGIYSLADITGQSYQKKPPPPCHSLTSTTSARRRPVNLGFLGGFPKLWCLGPKRIIPKNGDLFTSTMRNPDELLNPVPGFRQEKRKPGVCDFQKRFWKRNSAKAGKITKPKSKGRPRKHMKLYDLPLFQDAKSMPTTRWNVCMH